MQQLGCIDVKLVPLQAIMVQQSDRRQDAFARPSLRRQRDITSYLIRQLSAHSIDKQHPRCVLYPCITESSLGF